jgi:hypothetical protein
MLLHTHAKAMLQIAIPLSAFWYVLVKKTASKTEKEKAKNEREDLNVS